MNQYESDDIEALLGTLEYEEPEADDLAEQRGRRRFAPLPNVPSGGLSPPRAPGQAVTQTQLQALATRVDGRLKQLDTKTGVLERRINTVNAEQSRQAAALRKEIAERKKQQAQTTNQLGLMLVLTTLLGKTSRSITAATSGLQQGDKVLIDTDGFSAILPLLLIGGLGGGGGYGGLGMGGEGDQTTPLILLLALSGGLGK